MKKLLSLVLCTLMTLSLLIGCTPADDNERVSFKATVLEKKDASLLVEPDKESTELNSSDRIIVSITDSSLFNSQNDSIAIDDIKTGDLLVISYNGLIAESYPAQINTCYEIQVIESAPDDTAEMIFEKGFYRPNYNSLLKEITEWVSYAQEVPCVQEKIHNGHRYFLITEGARLSERTAAKVEDVIAQADKLEIRITSVSDEGKDSDSFSSFDLVILENNELPFHCTDADNPDEYFMGLIGLREIDKKVVAASEWIKIFSPQPHEKIGDTILLTGLANVFEGTVSYQLLTGDNEVLDSGFTTAAMGDWGYFEENILIPSDLNDETLTLQLYSESMKDGSKMFVVDIPLLLAN